MIDRENVIDAINTFIDDKSLTNAIILLEILCDQKKAKNKNKLLAVAISNPTIVTVIINDILIELQKEFQINKIIDSTNNLIMVF